jgi:hypothetical protein
MKKLIFAAAAVAGMGAFALESANVVGFQDVEAPQGDSMRCPTFTAVGTEGYDLTQIKVVGGYGMGDIVAQTVGSDGIWNGEYYWLTEDNAFVPTGWYKDAFGAEAVEVEDVILNKGKALYVHSDSEALNLTVSGEVKKGAIELPFGVGAGMLGNALPVDVDLVNITVTGGYGMGDINAQSIGADGVWNGEYYWLTEDNAFVPTGWYKDAFGAEAVSADEVILAPGEALYFHSDSENLTVTLPAAI